MHTVEARAYCFRRFTPASLAVSRPEGEYRLMHILDAEIQTATALVVDANAASRGVLVTMLKEFGVANVLQARRAQEARRVLETQRFDIVVCEYHFEGEPVSGQDIMDDLRLAHLLPLSTVAAVQSVDPRLIKTARSFGASRMQIWAHVIFPAVLPQVFTMQRINNFAAWMAVLAAEMVGLKNGVGMIVILGREMFNPNLIMLGICIIGVTGYAVDALLLLIQRKVLWWKPE